MSSFFENILATCCSATTIIRFTIPGKDIYNIYKTKITTKFPYFVLINTILNSVFWFYYWLHMRHPFFIFNTIYGITTNLFYLIVFINCLDITDEKRKKLIFISIVSPIIIYLMLLVFQITYEYVAIIATFFNTLMLASPLQKINKCFKEKDNSYLPLNIILLNTFSSTGYVIYATVYYNWNVFLMITHTTSLFLGVFQIFVYYHFSKIEVNNNDYIYEYSNKNYSCNSVRSSYLRNNRSISNDNSGIIMNCELKDAFNNDFESSCSIYTNNLNICSKKRNEVFHFERKDIDLAHYNKCEYSRKYNKNDINDETLYGFVKKSIRNTVRSVV